MNYRNVQLLKLLADGKACTIADLAAQMNVSQRLIRYEIVNTNDFLVGRGFAPIVVAGKHGVRFAAAPDEQEKLGALLDSLGVRECYPAPEQRKDYMLLTLLDSEDYITSRQFADSLQVSKSTIDKDLSDIRARLPADLTLEGRTGRGLRLVGSERQLRNMAFGLVLRNIDFDTYLSGEYACHNHMTEAVVAMCGPGWMPAVTGALSALECGSGKKLTFNSYKELVLYLAVILGRLQKGKHVFMAEDDLKLLRSTKEYLLAARLVANIEKSTGIHFVPGEVGLVTNLLLGAGYVSAGEYCKEDWVQVQVVSDFLIKEMERRLGIPFSRDKGLYYALQMHLGPGLMKIKNRIPVSNPNLEQIKGTYPRIFEALAGIFADGSLPAFQDISGDEIGYITLHFCASQERRKRSFPPCNVVIVCTHGAGTGYLIKELLCARFPSVHVLGVTTRAELENKFAQTADLIVSSVPVKHPAVPVVQVNSIPTEEDYREIAAAIEAMGPGRDQGEEEHIQFFQDLMAAVEENCTVENAQGLLGDMAGAFYHHNCPVHLEKVQPGLADLLGDEFIAVGVRAANWEEAVRAAGELICRSGAAREEFVESMVKTVEEMGPYIVVAPGVALPHGRIGYGIHRLGMSLITLETPVPFFHPTNDPVRVVFCLAPVDHYAHLQALADFMSLLERGKLREIMEARSVEQINMILHAKGEENAEAFV